MEVQEQNDGNLSVTFRLVPQGVGDVSSDGCRM